MKFRTLLRHPKTSIVVVFVAWKLFLLGISIGSAAVGDAYDTSASLTLEAQPKQSAAVGASSSPTLAHTLITRLTSWDAIYFVQAAHRGYLFEQEWAFGSGLPLVIAALSRGLSSLGLIASRDDGSDLRLLESLLGVLVASTSHLLSALVLYHLADLVCRDRRRALVAALAHVISPAGVFLSAPYAESPFALFSFAGYLLLAKSCVAPPAWGDAFTLLAGIAFGIATTFRSNGILNGLPLAWEFVQGLAWLLEQQTQHRQPLVESLIIRVRRLFVLGISGILTASGSIIPQAVAYQRFCSSDPFWPGQLRRPWCDRILPSIYAFVQDRYWANGFLRYWTVSNLPLFMLASPMIFVLLRSGLDYVSRGATGPPVARGKSTDPSVFKSLIRSAATAQMILAVWVFTSSHVQIITRISSGSPLWYMWLAEQTGSKDSAGFASKLVMFMVMYASIQAVLFTSFLPPA